MGKKYIDTSSSSIIHVLSRASLLSYWSKSRNNPSNRRTFVTRLLIVPVAARCGQKNLNKKCFELFKTSQACQLWIFIPTDEYFNLTLKIKIIPSGPGLENGQRIHCPFTDRLLTIHWLCNITNKTVKKTFEGIWDLRKVANSCEQFGPVLAFLYPKCIQFFFEISEMVEKKRKFCVF